MNSREQFEAWVRENWPEQSLARFNTGEYQGFTVEHCWNGWQASRQTLEIGLPPASEDEYYQSQISGADRYREDAINILRAAGLKVKS